MPLREGFLSDRQLGYVVNGGFMTVYDAVCSLEKDLFHGSYGRHDIDHLTADRACLTGGEIAVVALIKSYAYFARGFHLELLKSSLCFGNHNLIVGTVSHFCFLLICRISDIISISKNLHCIAAIADIDHTMSTAAIQPRF